MQNPVLDPSYGDYMKQINIWDHFVFESKEFVKLNSTHQKFLRDILDAMLSRYDKGQPTGIWDINSIIVRDNVACLPPPSSCIPPEGERSSSSLPTDSEPKIPKSFHPVELFFNLVMGVLGTDGSSPARESFYDLLIVLVQEKDDEVCRKGLRSLHFHRLLNSSKDNTNFIGDALAYLRQNESLIEKQLGNRSWQASFEDWSADKTYDIGNSVHSDKYFKLVYNHRKGGYSNSCVGLLHFMKNLFKHLNDHRRDDGVQEWNDEQIEMTTELYFPGEMENFYQFLWFVGIPMDFRKSRSPIPPIFIKASTGETATSTNSGESLGTSNALRKHLRTHAATRELKNIKASDIELKGVHSLGTYRDVSWGIWKTPKESINVAVKLMRTNFTVGQLLRLRADFWKEARVLRQLRHPYIGMFHGVVTNGSALATVTEYHCSLKQVLIGKNLTVDHPMKLTIALEAAIGMEYLHGKGIAHFSLRLSNVFLDIGNPEQPTCKIGDLGVLGFERSELFSGGVDTIVWMAPELLNRNSKSNLVTEKANVYSFGIVMWELLMWHNPYSLRGVTLAGMIKGSYPLPSWFYPTWISLMRRCWSFDPDSRPCFSEIAMELQGMLAATNI